MNPVGLRNVLLNHYDKYMNLKIFLPGGNDNIELKNTYLNGAIAHNNKLYNAHHTIDAGFDLFVPTTAMGLNPSSLAKVDFQLICSAQMMLDSGKTYNTGYYMYPRSSLSKTKLRLANSTGIIDAGYRGNLIGVFDVLDNTSYQKFDRLLQICAPGLVPIVVQVVDSFEELGEETARGAGGFGSTGR